MIEQKATVSVEAFLQLGHWQSQERLKTTTTALPRTIFALLFGCSSRKSS